ncbi:MAG: RNA polymerase sigma factor [Flavobacteriales bacterium]|nr:RNA polymerase sigma factor [Flavobacteriales bacterium]MBV6483691.1 ECF RNA polymerase sigma factor SigR [Flavobacteriales bacterium]MBX2958749.1 RNA polymerase sigma factor [Flavobacteriales bacterium]HRN40757.1 RNA polymerase sigma factor [Vicingus sp.]
MKLSDEQLVKKCLEKDPLAQKQLFESFSRKMMGVCLRYTKDAEEAQDVLQIGFVKVFEKLHLFNNEGSLEGWIRKVLVNCALDQIRKNKKFDDNVDLSKVDFQMASENENVLEHLSANDLLKIIQAMPTGFRTVFNLYAIEGYSHQEIADQLNISINTSKSQYSRARVYLQKIILEEKIL